MSSTRTLLRCACMPTQLHRQITQHPRALLSWPTMRMLSTQSPIIGPESTDYTPWTFSETDTTYKPHPDGFDHSRDRIREAKKSILGDLLTGSASKRTMDKLCEQFPGGLAELEDMQKDNKEHKEDMASDRKLSTNISTFLIVATFMFCTIGSQFLGLWMIERAGTSPKEESS